MVGEIANIGVVSRFATMENVQLSTFLKFDRDYKMFGKSQNKILSQFYDPTS